jgi:hypothetical protein
MLIELVMGLKRYCNAVVIKQYTGRPGILGKNEVCGPQHLNGTQGYITKVADGGWHEVKLRHLY